MALVQFTRDTMIEPKESEVGILHSEFVMMATFF